MRKMGEVTRVLITAPLEPNVRVLFPDARDAANSVRRIARDGVDMVVAVLPQGNTTAEIKRLVDIASEECPRTVVAVEAGLLELAIANHFMVFDGAGQAAAAIRNSPKHVANKLEEDQAAYRDLMVMLESEKPDLAYKDYQEYFADIAAAHLRDPNEELKAFRILLAALMAAAYAAGDSRYTQMFKDLFLGQYKGSRRELQSYCEHYGIEFHLFN